MLGQQSLQIRIAAPRHSGPRQASNRDAQRIAGFDVIICRHIVVRQDEHAGTRRSMRSLVELNRGTRKQPAKLHLQQRKPRSQPRISEAPFKARRAAFWNLFNRNARDRATIYSPWWKNFSWLGFRWRLYAAYTSRRLGATARLIRRLRRRDFTAVATAPASAPPVFFVAAGQVV